MTQVDRTPHPGARSIHRTVSPHAEGVAGRAAAGGWRSTAFEIIADAIEESGRTRGWIAAQLGYGKATLDHWLSPSDGREMPFVVGVQLLGDPRILGGRARDRAITRLAAAMGFSAQPMGPRAASGWAGLVPETLGAGRAVGELQAAVIDAVSDGSVSRAEAVKIRDAAAAVHQSVASVSAAAAGGGEGEGGAL